MGAAEERGRVNRAFLAVNACMPRLGFIIGWATCRSAFAAERCFLEPQEDQ